MLKTLIPINYTTKIRVGIVRGWGFVPPPGACLETLVFE